MTREVAINHLKTVAKSAIDSGYDSAVVDAVNMAKEALEQEPCEDAISKAEVIKLIDKHTNDDGTLDDDITCILENLPPIQPKVKVGHWIPTYGNVKCSVCGNVKDSRNVGKATHYCDFCGAKMQEVEK